MNDNSKTPSVAKVIYEYIETFVIAACIVLLAYSFVARLCAVDGPSMNNTLTHGEMLVVTELGFEPEYGDIVVFHETSTPEKPYGLDKLVVKRVIATEGQTVTIDYDLNTVCVDGTVLEEPYIQYNEIDPMLSPDWQPLVQYTVPEGCVFVLGDNRNHSSDSRNSRYGMIPVEDLLGKVTKVLPFKLPER